MARKKKEDTRTPQKIIADMCPLLESVGATYVRCEYEARDYEGDTHSMRCEYGQRDEVGAMHFAPASRFSVHQGVYTDPTITAAISTRELYDVMHELTSSTTDKPALLTNDDVEKFKRAVRQILPENWADEAGSYGQVVINTVNRKIDIHHTKRVVEMRNQTITYAAGSDTPTITNA
jgi:hypothetical protein